MEKELSPRGNKQSNQMTKDEKLEININKSHFFLCHQNQKTSKPISLKIAKKI